MNRCAIIFLNPAPTKPCHLLLRITLTPCYQFREHPIIHFPTVSHQAQEHLSTERKRTLLALQAQNQTNLKLRVWSLVRTKTEFATHLRVRPCKDNLALFDRRTKSITSEFYLWQRLRKRHTSLRGRQQREKRCHAHRVQNITK